MALIEMKFGYLAWVLLVGFIGGFLGLSRNYAKIKRTINSKALLSKSLFHKFLFVLILLCKVLFYISSSMLICWIAYELAAVCITKTEACLAIGCFCAFRGVDWVIGTVDTAIKKKIETMDENDEYEYKDDDLGDLPRPPREYR